MLHTLPRRHVIANEGRNAGTALLCGHVAHRTEERSLTDDETSIAGGVRRHADIDEEVFKRVGGRNFAHDCCLLLYCVAFAMFV